MSEIIVQKYGGSSVADPQKLGIVADRVAEAAREGRRVVVVVSAMGRTTDELIALAQRVAPEPSRRELDMLLSTGERISMALLAMALEARGIQAISFTGSQSGIMTNDRHSGARIIEVRPIRIEDELARGKVVIVAGFQGMSYRREITTLGRGGSDTTAVALAAALGADCEIYSDVDGVYTADPRVVPEARRLDQLGYDEMQALAEHGAKVLNAQAVEWARRAGVVIHARATGGGGETRIGAAAGDAARPGRPGGGGAPARAVTAARRVTRLGCAWPTPGRAVLERIEAEGVQLRQLSCGARREHAAAGGAWLSATLVRDDLPDWPRTARALGALGAEIVEEGQVTVVGPGLGEPALIRRVLAAAEEAAAAGGEAPPGGEVLLGVEVAPLRLTVTIPSPGAPEDVSAAAAAEAVHAARVDAVTRALHALLA